MQEGELRPQLLDRFGMSVNVVTLLDVDTRLKMVLDRMAYEEVSLHNNLVHAVVLLVIWRLP